MDRRSALKLGGAATVGVATLGFAGSGVASAWGEEDHHHDHDHHHSHGGVPKPIEGGSPILADAFGTTIPFFLPIEIDPFTGLPAGGPFDPSTITDFDGFVSVVEIDGVTGHNSDGTDRRWAADARIIEGVYKDREGHKREGAFTFL